jgi:hypothetical protein
MKPQFRNSDKLQVLPFREWLRTNMPTAHDGFVVEDLDLVIRWYGVNGFGTEGVFMFLELKFWGYDIGLAQKKTFGMIDRLLRMADPKKEKYKGFFVIQYSDENWNNANFRINGKPANLSEFTEFLKMKNVPNSYYFGN